MNDMAPDAPLLFAPIKLRSVVARNRIVSSPMCQYMSDDGGPGQWQLVNFGRFAMSGTGIVFGEETAVERQGRKTHHCAGIYKDGHIRDYGRINDFIRSLGAVPAIQLGREQTSKFRSDRKNRCRTRGKRSMSPSAAERGLPCQRARISRSRRGGRSPRL